MISDELYERLSKMKRPRESFSVVINRLLKHKVKLKEVAGSRTISFKEWEDVKEAFKDREKTI